MACLPVTYALCWLVMASSVSEAKEEDTNTFTLVPSRRISSIVHPQSGTTTHVQEGTNVTLVCQNAPGKEKNNDVIWYRTDGTHKTYSMFVQCHITLDTAKNLDGKASCFNKSYGLMIQNIDKQNEERWYCLADNKWRSEFVEIKVDSPNVGSTSQRISSPTTTMVKDVTSTSKSTKGTTGYSTERTDNESASINTLVPLIGGAAGGALVLLALVITGCVLYRSRRKVNKPNDGRASTTDSNRDPGANVEGAVVMEGNLMYGNDDYAQIPCREPASASHEMEDASVLKNQPDTEDRNTNQPGVDSADIYAVPDKPKKSTVEEKEDASVLKNQPDTEDRNTNQPGVDSGDIYAVADKPKKSTVEDVEDVYSQVQKPKKGIE